MGYILEEMDELKADGVDFVSIVFDDRLPPPVICSYTREQCKDVKAYPRLRRMYWRMVEGKKMYIDIGERL